MPRMVLVTVNSVGSTHAVTVMPESLPIPAGERGPIQWKITNPAAEGWRFQTNGIEIANAGAEFDHPNGGGGVVFTWNNNHTKPATYKYTVRVANNTANAEIDPWIANN